MEPIDVSRLPLDALVVLDSARIIYLLEDIPNTGAASNRFLIRTRRPRPLRSDDDYDCRGPDGSLAAGEEMLARRYRSILESWRVIDLDGDIAESAARVRGLFRL